MSKFATTLETFFHNARALTLFERFGVSPFRGGIILCLGWIALVLLVEGVTGRLAMIQSTQDDFLIEVSMAIFLGVFLFYVVAAFAAQEARTIKTIEALRQLDELSQRELTARIEKLGRFPLWRMLLVCFLGLSIGIAAPLAEYVIIGDYAAYQPALWGPEVYVHRILGPLLGVAVSVLIHAIVSDSVQFWSLARRLRSVDLTNLGRYSPFTEQGLTNAAIIMGFVSMFAFVAIFDRYVFLVGSVLSYGVVAALLGMLLPVWALRGRIKAEKEKEASWCRERIPAVKVKLLAGQSGAAQELASLIVYLRDIENVNTWPVAPGGVTRFGLFLLIPLGSWAGGALMERFVDAAIG
jgi:hypothetical protein